MIDFSNVTTQANIFNITYYQQFLSRKVTIEEVIDYGELENNTKTESYRFSIDNNEDSLLNIPYFEIDGLAGLNSSELEKVEVYINNGFVFASPDQKAIKPNMHIQPFSVGNITVIIPRHRN